MINPNKTAFLAEIENNFNLLKEDRTNFKLELAGIGYLVPIKFEDISNLEMIEKFCNWRNQNSSAFPGNHQTNIQRTIQWIDRHVLRNPLRILFKIYSNSGELIGHSGLIVSEQHECVVELDNILRGKQDIEKGIMSETIQNLIDWTFKTFNPNGIFLKVLRSNKKAITFYEKNGFLSVSSFPIYNSQENSLNSKNFFEIDEKTNPNDHFEIMTLNQKTINHINFNN